jgi:hypothetical protein
MVVPILRTVSVRKKQADSDMSRVRGQKNEIRATRSEPIERRTDDRTTRAISRPIVSIFLYIIGLQ